MTQHDPRKLVHSETFKNHRIDIYEENVHPITISSEVSSNFVVAPVIMIDNVERPNNVGNLSSKPVDDARKMIDFFLTAGRFP